MVLAEFKMSASYPDLPLHELFRRSAEEHKDKIAVYYEGRTVTYGQLSEQTEELALSLVHHGVRNDSIVGIYMDRCDHYVTAYVAALMAGGAYMPLEVAQPVDGIAAICEDARPVAVVTTEAWAPRMLEACSAMKSAGNHAVPVVIVLHNDSSKDVWRLDSADRAAVVANKLPVKVHLDNLAYVVYSSGTTGKPKGILAPHRGAVLSYTFRQTALPYVAVPEEREACNVFFVWECFRPLMSGVTLYVIPDDVIYDPEALSLYVHTHQITRMLFTPSLLEAVLATLPAAKVGELFSSLLNIILCGEVVSVDLCSRVLDTLPKCRLWNLYSISEAHDITFTELTKDNVANALNGPEKRKYCSVGALIPGVHVYVLDDNLKSLPKGVAGEIYIGGPTLARGYLNRPVLNRERFIDNPFDSNVSKLYRTGDWGYFLPNGELEIAGRCDSMVKIRGYSVELRAIENAIMEDGDVNASVVTAEGEEGNDKYVVAYIVLNSVTAGGGPASMRRHLRESLKLKLPHYMIPAHFVFLRELPLTPAGKLDKRKLPHVDRGGVVTDVENLVVDAGRDDNSSSTVFTGELSGTEAQVLPLWKSALLLGESDSVDPNESFFDLGGHSLTAARLVSALKPIMSSEVTVSVSDVFRYPTLSMLAAYIDSQLGNGTVTDQRVDLEKEVSIFGSFDPCLPVQLRAFWRAMNMKRRSKKLAVLLTGCTGYFGAHLLWSLLRSSDCQVFCLVRKSASFSGEQRLLKALKHLGLYEDIAEQWSHVHVLEGDTGLDRLGLSEDEYYYLGVEVDCIIHAAAQVHFVYPYTALKSSNVIGTKNILDFAFYCKIKALHYVSTNGIFPLGKTDISEDCDISTFVSDLSDGYSQSKWVAERIVRRAAAAGLPCVVYRPGNLFPVARKSEKRWNGQDFTHLFLKACLMSGVVPSIPQWSVEGTPVDFAADFVVDLLLRSSHQSFERTYHLISPSPTSYETVFSQFRERGYPLEVVSASAWAKEIQRKSSSVEDNTVYAAVTSVFSTFTSDTWDSTNISTFKIDNVHTHLTNEAAGNRLPTSYPTVDSAAFDAYLSAWQKSGDVPMPPTDGAGAAAKVAIVTGASSGIGRAIAQELCNAGYCVALVARRKAMLDDVVADLGPKAVAFPADVTDRTGITEMVERVESTLGPVDVLVNAAGVMYYTYMKNVRVDDWERQIDINCKGPLNCIAAVMNSMISRRSGHIINISSDAGRKAFPGLSVYSGTKYFIEAMSRGLRAELVEHGVKVTTIQPGDVQTELLQHSKDEEAFADFVGDVSELYNVGHKVLQPKDISDAVLYVLQQHERCAVNEILIEPREAPI